MSQKRTIEAVYPLTPMEQGMLFHTLYAPESGVYFEQFRCTLKGPLHVEAFAEAWQQVVDRHAALRTSFSWQQLDKTVQVVLRQISLPLTQQDWRGFSTGEQASKLQTYLQTERHKGFDLAKAPLMRLGLMQTAVNEHIFIWNYHHLLLDGWSVPLVLKEVLSLYEAICQGQPAHLSHPPAYQEYITWLAQQDETAAAAYWQKTLAGFTTPTPLVVDHSAANQSAQFAEAQIRLSETTTTALQTLARQQKLTLNTFIQGAWALLLHRYSGSEDIVFGATVSGRPPQLAGVEQMIGLFINTLPLRVAIRPRMPVIDWLQQLQACWVEARQYEHSALSQIQGWSDVPRGTPLFNSILVFENFPVDAALLANEGSLTVSHVQAIEQANYPLTLVSGLALALPLRLAYDGHLFEEATIRRMLGHLQTLLQGIIAQPTRCIVDLPLLTAAEQQQIMVDWNETQVDFPVDKTVTQLFEEQVERTPTATAVVFGEQKLTFAVLNRRANQLAHWLQKQGVGPEIVVGLSVEPSLEMIIGILGILKAGGAYLPLDPDYPADRLTFMLTDAWPSLVLTQQSRQPLVTPNAIPTLALDTEWPMVAQEPTINSASAGTADSLAYIIYTSGSTGQPKGTLLAHCGLVNFAHAFAQDMVIGPGSRVLQFASISFDASVAEIFTTLLAGATLCLAPRETMASIPDLTQLLQVQVISTAVLPPAVWELLNPDALPDLHTAISAGEACPPKIAQRWATGRRFFNAYGPTETTVGAAWYRVPEATNFETAVPIGKPIANTQLYILDHQGQPVPVGVPGELHIGGWGWPEAT